MKFNVFFPFFRLYFPVLPNRIEFLEQVPKKSIGKNKFEDSRFHI